MKEQQITHGLNGQKSARQIMVRKKQLLYLDMTQEFTRQQLKNSRKTKMEIFDLPKSVKMAKRFQNDIFRITVTHATIPYRTTTN